MGHEQEKMAHGREKTVREPERMVHGQERRARERGVELWWGR